MLGEASAGGEQAVQLAGLLKIVESAEGGQDALANAAALTRVFDNLQILAGLGFLDAEERRGKNYSATVENLSKGLPLSTLRP
jgi:hypothetical protein